LKSKISQKGRNIRLQKSATGNKAIREAHLTALELRVIGLIGSNYIEGSPDCPDSVPEEEVNTQVNFILYANGKDPFDHIVIDHNHSQQPSNGKTLGIIFF